MAFPSSSTKSSIDPVSKIERAIKALDLRKAGKSYVDIGKALGISATKAFGIIRSELHNLNDRKSSTAEEILRLEIERCYELIQSLWPRKSEPRTAEVILKTIERISKFYGLDKPLKIEQSISIEDMSYEQLMAESERIGLKTISQSEFEVQDALPGLDTSRLAFLPGSKEAELIETKDEVLVSKAKKEAE